MFTISGGRCAKAAFAETTSASRSEGWSEGRGSAGGTHPAKSPRGWTRPGAEASSNYLFFYTFAVLSPKTQSMLTLMSSSFPFEVLGVSWLLAVVIVSFAIRQMLAEKRRRHRYRQR